MSPCLRKCRDRYYHQTVAVSLVAFENSLQQTSLEISTNSALVHKALCTDREGSGAQQPGSSWIVVQVDREETPV